MMHADQQNRKELFKLNRNNTNFILQLFELFKKIKADDKYSFLKYYQNAVRIFFNHVEIDSRGLLVQHQMGLGKSILAISIAMDLMKERTPIILLTKSLQENMLGAIHKYVKLRKSADPNYHLGRLSEMELDDWITHNFSFVSMNASNMLKQMSVATEGHAAEEFDTALEKKFGSVLKMASLDGKLLIVDEAHNLFRAITNGSKNAIGLYDLVMKSKNLKILFLTGTPIANDPFELVPCFNMLGSRYGKITLPENHKDFYKLFVDEKHNKIKNKEKFQNRIFGLASYVTHQTRPGFGVGESNEGTKVEFPEEKPIVVERVHMDSKQYVSYQLARDKEKEEGSGGARGVKFDRIVELAPLTKPKSHAASTYRVKSRQLGNFSASAEQRDEKDASKISEQTLGAAKYRKILSNIDEHMNQLGIVYSQFIGVGGLGTFSRYLESQNWERVVLEVKKSRNNIVQNDEIPHDLDMENEIDELPIEGGIDYNFHGPSIPTADVLLRDFEQELSLVPKSTWWLKNDLFFQNPAEVINNDKKEHVFSILDEVLIDDAATSTFTFRYAENKDIETIKNLDSNYIHTNSDLKYPKYILLVLDNDKPIGYVNIKYNTDENDGIKTCGEITSAYIPHCAVEKTLKKIINDVINCRTMPGEFKKRIFGGNYVNVTGAVPEARPDRKRKFAIISGEIDVETRAKIQEMFNDDKNKHGGLIDLILISSTGAEGLDLKNVRHIHIMEPYWNWGRIKQIIARGVRNDSHKSLPNNEKNVQPYIYLAIPPETERSATGEFPPTTDMELYEESIRGQVTIESFLDAIREVCIECMLNGEDFCRICSPTNKPLFTDDVARDVRAADPCTKTREEQVRVEEIIVDGIKYYYSKDPDSIYDYRIFIFDEDVNGYRQLSESDPRYIKIIDALSLKKE